MFKLRGLVVVFSFLAAFVTINAQSIGQQCSIQTGGCNTGLVCDLSSFLCIAGCSPSCPQGQVCIGFGGIATCGTPISVSTVGSTASFIGSTGIMGSSGGPGCSACTSFQFCLNNMCQGGDSSCGGCPANHTCSLGVCIPLPGLGCTNCPGNCVTGVCIPPPPTCNPTCLPPQVCVQVPGQTVASCVGPGASCSVCAGTCFQGACAVCPVCQSIPNGLGNALATLGFNFSAFVNQTTPNNYATFDGNCPPGTITTLANSGSISVLNFNGGAGQNAAVSTSVPITVNNIVASCNSAFQLGTGGVLTASAGTIQPTGVLSYNLASGCSVTMNGLNVSGTLNFAGGGSVNLGVTAAGAQGNINIGDNIMLGGNGGTALLVLSNVKSAVPACTINNFNTSGNIGQSVSGGLLTVAGGFNFRGTTITPGINCSMGNFFISGPSLSGQALQIAGGTISFNTSGTVSFTTVTGCIASSSLVVQLTGSFSSGTVQSSGTIMSYSSVSGPLVCPIILKDSTGATVTVTGSAVSSNSRIRSSSSYSATWGSSSLTYSKSAAFIKSPTFLVIASVMTMSFLSRYF